MVGYKIMLKNKNHHTKETILQKMNGIMVNLIQTGSDLAVELYTVKIITEC